MTHFDLQEAEEFFTQLGEQFFKTSDRAELVEEFGVLKLPKTSKEAEQCIAVRKILGDFSKRKSPPQNPPKKPFQTTLRPLSIAVFGPPGSGKSTTVRQLSLKAGGIVEEPYEINLSQMNNPDELSQALQKIFPKPPNENEPTPLVFFDEFDAALGGDPLGWLRWFLAPMQDGFLLYRGEKIVFGKTIFVFAGGTADTYQEFEARHSDYFVRQKGPDFISRLRGFLNIEGLNKYGSERILRRALVLHHQLGKRAENLKGKNGIRKIDPDLLSRLLAGAHYIHGARSLEALLDMCALTDIGVNEDFDEDHLPPKELIQLHVSRGPLDGLTVGISAGQDPSSNEFVAQLADKLFERGAVVAHGGELLAGNPLQAMVKILQDLPSELVERTEKRIINYLAYPSFLRDDVRKSQKKYKDFVEFVNMESVSAAEFQALHVDPSVWFSALDSAENKLAWALSLFRMRLRLAQEIDVLVVFGGKRSGGWGRFPGVAEEVMLALAYQRPVYVLGMAKGDADTVGAAKAIGHCLGLSGIQHTVSEFLPDPCGVETAAFREILRQWSPAFEVPARPGLPTTVEELRKYLRDHAIGKSNWPQNGLTEKENRRIFDADNDTSSREMCVEHIVKGISRLLAEGALPK